MSSIKNQIFQKQFKIYQARLSRDNFRVSHLQTQLLHSRVTKIFVIQVITREIEKKTIQIKLFIDGNFCKKSIKAIINRKRIALAQDMLPLLKKTFQLLSFPGTLNYCKQIIINLALGPKWERIVAKNDIILHGFYPAFCFCDFLEQTRKCLWRPNYIINTFIYQKFSCSIILRKINDIEKQHHTIKHWIKTKSFNAEEFLQNILKIPTIFFNITVYRIMKTQKKRTRKYIKYNYYKLQEVEVTSGLKIATFFQFSVYYIIASPNTKITVMSLEIEFICISDIVFELKYKKVKIQHTLRKIQCIKLPKIKCFPGFKVFDFHFQHYEFREVNRKSKLWNFKKINISILKTNIIIRPSKIRIHKNVSRLFYKIFTKDVYCLQAPMAICKNTFFRSWISYFQYYQYQSKLYVMRYISFCIIHYWYKKQNKMKQMKIWQGFPYKKITNSYEKKTETIFYGYSNHVYTHIKLVSIFDKYNVYYKKSFFKTNTLKKIKKKEEQEICSLCKSFFILQYIIRIHYKISPNLFDDVARHKSNIRLMHLFCFKQKVQLDIFKTYKWKNSNHVYFDQYWVKYWKKHAQKLQILRHKKHLFQKLIN